MFNTRDDLQISVVGDFGALHRQPSTDFGRNTALDLTASGQLWQTAVRKRFSFFSRNFDSSSKSVIQKI